MKVVARKMAICQKINLIEALSLMKVIKNGQENIYVRKMKMTFGVCFFNSPGKLSRIPKILKFFKCATNVLLRIRDECF